MSCLNIDGIAFQEERARKVEAMLEDEKAAFIKNTHKGLEAIKKPKRLICRKIAKAAYIDCTSPFMLIPQKVAETGLEPMTFGL